MDQRAHAQAREWFFVDSEDSADHTGGLGGSRELSAIMTAGAVLPALGAPTTITRQGTGKPPRESVSSGSIPVGTRTVCPRRSTLSTIHVEHD